VKGLRGGNERAMRRMISAAPKERAVRPAPPAVIAAAVFAMSAFMFLASCQSAPRDRLVDSGTQEDMVQLDAVDQQLIDLQVSPDAARLAALRAQLERSADRTGASRLYQARAAGLQGQAALLAGDTASARTFADQAIKLSDTDDGGWLVRAALEPDQTRRLAILEQGLSKSDRKSRLLCERGETFLRLSRYGEAAQDLDEGLRGLGERYKALYGPDRERALSLAQAQRASGSTTAVIAPQTAEGALTVRAMVERAFSSTTLLTAWSADPHPRYESVKAALAGAGLLLQPDASPSAPCTRKDVAFFLWRIILHAERGASLEGTYRARYKATPVPDVPVDAPWFEAVLGVVEREVMDLPDGVHFQPDAGMSELEYQQALSRLSRLYR